MPSDNEDEALGDFFAKKDKGKKSSKKKKDKKVKESGEATVDGVKETKEVENEWGDFEEPVEKDYSCLKINDLQLVEEKEDEVPEETDVINEDGSVTKKSTAVWEATGPAPATTAPKPEP